MGDDLRELIGPAPPPPEDAASDLPPAELRDNPRPASSGGGTLRPTLVMTAVLVVAVVGVVATVAPPAHPTVAHDLLRVGWPFVLVGAVAWWLRAQYRGGTEFMRRLAPGTRALADGQVERAAAVFAEVATRYAAQPAFAGGANLYLAGAQLRGGRLADAAATLRTVERARGVLVGASTRCQAAAHLAVVAALRGELDASARWHAAATQHLRRADATTERNYPEAVLTLAAMILAARRGELDLAARTFDAAAPRLEAAFAVTQMKAAWAVRAFVAARWTGPRDLAAAEPWLRRIRDARTDEVDYLATAWPELQAFLAAAR